MSNENRAFNVPADVLNKACEDRGFLGARSDDEGDAIVRSLTRVKLGTLNVPSGKIIAGDAGMGFSLDEPLVRTVPPGVFPVWSSVWGLEGRGKSPSDQMGDCPRAAYLALQLKDTKPVLWQFAATDDKPENWVPSETWDGLGVDVGKMGFLDVAHLADLRRLQEEDFEAFAEFYKEDPKTGGTGGLHHLPLNLQLSVPVCESGWGDGSYFAYWGIDATGAPSILIIDFDLDRKWPSY